LKAKEKELKQVNNDLKQLQKDKEFLTEEKKEAIRSRTRFELDLKDVEERLRSGKKKDKDASAALKKIQGEIDAASKTLEEIRPKFAAAQDEEQKLKARVMERERKVQELYTKMGRSAQFKTRAERDAWIKKEVQDLKKTIASKEREANELADTIAQLKEKIETENERIANREEGLQERRNALEATTKECNTKKEKRDEFHNRRRALWQEESELDKNLEAIREGIIRAERQLQSSMSKELSSGLAAVQKVVTGSYKQLKFPLLIPGLATNFISRIYRKESSWCLWSTYRAF
jgi:structural maintenance of chromosome 3 (chondroitin sulfate proteoglycan 6)